jgi:hypothetical protein
MSHVLRLVSENSNAGALYKNPFLDFATPVLSKSPALEPRLAVLVRTANARKEVIGAADSLGDVIYPGKETSEREAASPWERSCPCYSSGSHWIMKLSLINIRINRKHLARMVLANNQLIHWSYVHLRKLALRRNNIFCSPSHQGQLVFLLHLPKNAMQF